MKDILHGNVVIQKKNLQLIQHVLLIIIVGCVMRKFLLLAAEANLMAGNQAEANACLNEVRQRAKLPFKEATLDAIKIEKRLELFCEYTRYQDIIRWEDAENLLKHQGEKTPLLVNENDKVEVVYMQYNKDPERYGFKPRHYLLPIPATEIRQNPSMVQNEVGNFIIK